MARQQWLLLNRVAPMPPFRKGPGRRCEALMEHRLVGDRPDVDVSVARYSLSAGLDGTELRQGLDKRLPFRGKK